MKSVKNVKKTWKKIKENACERLIKKLCQNLPSIQLLSSHTQSWSLSNFNTYLNVHQ